MKLKDVLMELLLVLFDHFMDKVTYGAWSRACGDVVPNIRIKDGSG